MRKGVRFLLCLAVTFVLWLGMVFLVGQVLVVWIGPTGDQITYDKPTNPDALRRHFSYLYAVWQQCRPLGYISLNLDADVYVGEADCQKSPGTERLREAFRQDLMAQESRALWVQESKNLFLVAWPCSILAKSCEPGESAFLIEGSRVIFISGELVCSKGQVTKRERCYNRELSKYLAVLPQVPRGKSCFEAGPGTGKTSAGTGQRVVGRRDIGFFKSLGVRLAHQETLRLSAIGRR